MLASLASPNTHNSLDSNVWFFKQFKQAIQTSLGANDSPSVFSHCLWIRSKLTNKTTLDPDPCCMPWFQHSFWLLGQLLNLMCMIIYCQINEFSSNQINWVLSQCSSLQFPFKFFFWQFLWALFSQLPQSQTTPKNTHSWWATQIRCYIPN